MKRSFDLGRKAMKRRLEEQMRGKSWKEAGEDEDEMRDESESDAAVEAVERFIEDARLRACGEGSHGVAGPGDSQGIHNSVLAAIEAWEAGLVAKPTVEQLMEVVWDILNVCEVDLCQGRPRPTTGKKAIFPLPVSRCLDGFQVSPKVLRTIAACLNILNGVGITDCKGATQRSLRAMKRLSSALDGSPILRQELPQESFDDFFKIRWG